jgi:hypothetical protein
LSPDGHQAVVTASCIGTLVYDLAAHRVIARTPVKWQRVAFRPGAVIRHFASNGVWDLDTASGQATRAGATVGWYVSPDGERAVRQWKSPAVLDVRTGAVRQALDTSVFPGFLADGRFVGVESSMLGRLRVFSRDGVPERSINLPGGNLLLGGEPLPGRVLLGTRGPDQFKPGPGARTWLVDVNSGTSRLLAEGVLPVFGWRSGLAAAPIAQGESAMLALGPGGTLLRLDPETGARTVILDPARLDERFRQ